MDLEEKYKDPSNIDELIVKIKSSQTIGDLKQVLESVFPDWILGTMPGYSSDYPHLTANWKNVCDRIKVAPKEIVIVALTFWVKADDNNNNHKFISIAAEILTMSGFIVRMNGELIPCDKCSRAIPAKVMYDLMKNKGLNVPANWSNRCTNC